MHNEFWFKEKFQLKDFAQLEKRCQQANIKISEHPEINLVNLSYSANASSNDFFTNCCRGLVLDKQTLAVVARPFSRFFNYYEQNYQLLLDSAMDSPQFDCQTLEKIDGSLMKLFCYQGVWYVGTRSTAIADTNVPNAKLNFYDLFVWALQGKILSEQEVQNFTIKRKELSQNQLASNQQFLQEFAQSENLDPNVTYVFELCSPLNKGVLTYPLSVYFLASLYNQQDEMNEIHYLPDSLDDNQGEAQQLLDALQRQQTTIAHSSQDKPFSTPTIRYPQSYQFNTVHDMIESAKALQENGEGYVVYINGLPKVKIKSPAFVARHHQGDDNELSPNRMFEIIFAFEEDEWLATFPDDASQILPYVSVRDTAIAQAQQLFYQVVAQFLDITQENIEVGKDYKAMITAQVQAQGKPELVSAMMKFVFSQAQTKGIAQLALSLLSGHGIEENFARMTANAQKRFILDMMAVLDKSKN
ncbi:T4 RnlA family RNA ligase [Psychrobacter sp. I-STPA10]|uniref:T4 RnlA family RNA ligase n=1 Tax=Psychrobacter sp. I-STPA10 TaxID=2585769 RepID=UPI001E39A1DD|nr:T4 RnlA family RNA ligase [Psychrobacter sp. I-STPA10]